MRTTLDAVSLYVHLPWCVRKCPYCDFNSHVAAQIPEQDYVDALLHDLDFEINDIRAMPLRSIYFGGGTPSLFSVAAMCRLLEGIRSRVVLAPDAEITVEANPGAADQQRFCGYREAGVNRLSIGVQSFHDNSLERLGRVHDAAQARHAVKAAQRAEFQSVNLDLMFGLPGQSRRDALRDVEIAIGFAPAHLSIYQLTIEPNTRFYQQRPALPDDDVIWTMQESIQSRLSEAGYDQYEVSAYARPQQRCVHNLNYWRFGDYIGIGAGAHGKVSDNAMIERTWKVRSPASYITKAGSDAVIGETRRLVEREIGFEFMLNALRLTAGFDIDMFHRHTGLEFASVEDTVTLAVQRGWLSNDGHRVAPTASGYRFLDNVVESFLP